MNGKLRTFVVTILTRTIGAFLVFTQPQKREKLVKNGITNLRDTSRLTWKEKLMRRAILTKAKRNEDFNSLATFHSNYWINHGHNFFSSTEDRMEKEYLPTYKVTFDILKKQILKESDQFNTLVEIGTGDGSVLHFLSSKFPEIIRMVGIDLSEIQITVNIAKYKENPKLEFVAADGFQWVEQNGKSNMIFVTFRGVLEYFTQQRLQDFFKKLDSLGNILFFAVEPNALSHDFNSNPNSEIYGNECAFSHNYAKLFEDAGFSVWHLSKRIEGEHPDVTCIIGAKNF